MHYSDLVLVRITTNHGLGAVIGTVRTVALGVSTAVLGLVAIGFITHALFVNEPVETLRP